MGMGAYNLTITYHKSNPGLLSKPVSAKRWIPITEQEFGGDCLKEGSELELCWKIHILIVHVPEWLDLHSGGLRRYSEQTCEATHADFVQTAQSTLRFYCIYQAPKYAN